MIGKYKTAAEQFDEKFKETEGYLEDIRRHVESCDIDDLVLSIDEFKDSERYLLDHLSVFKSKFLRMKDDERETRTKQLDELKDRYFDIIIVDLKCECSKKWLIMDKVTIEKSKSAKRDIEQNFEAIADSIDNCNAGKIMYIMSRLGSNNTAYFNEGYIDAYEHEDNETKIFKEVEKFIDNCECSKKWFDMTVEIYTIDELTEQLDKLKEAVKNCDSSTPVIASDITKNLEVAFSLNKVNATELAQIHRKIYIEAKAFENSCSCK